MQGAFKFLFVLHHAVKGGKPRFLEPEKHQLRVRLRVFED
jgi:hypothetical protein